MCTLLFAAPTVPARLRRWQAYVEDTHDGKLYDYDADDNVLVMMLDNPDDALEAAAGLQRLAARSGKQETAPRTAVHSGAARDGARRAMLRDDGLRLLSHCSNGEIALSPAAWTQLSPARQKSCRGKALERVRGEDNATVLYLYEWRDAEQRRLPTAELHIEQPRPGELRFQWREPEEQARTLGAMIPRSLTADEQALLDRRRKEIADLLAAHAQWRAPTVLRRLDELGANLFELLLPEAIRSALQATTAEGLLLSLDDHTVALPWELLYDGSEFLCLRFAMGRQVRTTQPLPAVARRRPPEQIAVAGLIADPCNNLPGAAREGALLVEQLSRSGVFAVNAQQGGSTLADVEALLYTADILHYCGHAEFDSANPERSRWLLLGGETLTAAWLARRGGASRCLPRLVFCNACSSGATTAWDSESGRRVFGLANAFLANGAEFYLGAIAPVVDEASTAFAQAFYRGLEANAPLGAAVRDARRRFASREEQSRLLWASYVLYGRPDELLFHPTPPPLSHAVPPIPAAPPTVARKRATRTGWAAGAAALALGLAVAAGASRVLVSKEPAAGGATNGRDRADNIRLSLELLDGIERNLAQTEPAAWARAWNDRAVALAVPAFDDAERYEAFVRALEQSPRIARVDRRNLNELLLELRLATSSAAAADQPVEAGKLLPARLWVDAAVIGDVLQARVIDIQTSRILASVQESVRAPERLAAAVAVIARNAFPLRVLAQWESAGQAQLNAGANHGVHAGMEFVALTETEARARWEDPTTPLPAGAPRLKVTRADAESAVATLASGSPDRPADAVYLEEVGVGTRP